MNRGGRGGSASGGHDGRGGRGGGGGRGGYMGGQDPHLGQAGQQIQQQAQQAQPVGGGGPSAPAGVTTVSSMPGRPADRGQRPLNPVESIRRHRETTARLREEDQLRVHQQAQQQQQPQQQQQQSSAPQPQQQAQRHQQPQQQQQPQQPQQQQQPRKREGQALSRQAQRVAQRRYMKMVTRAQIEVVGYDSNGRPESWRIIDSSRGEGRQVVFLASNKFLRQETQASSAATWAEAGRIASGNWKKPVNFVVTEAKDNKEGEENARLSLTDEGLVKEEPTEQQKALTERRRAVKEEARRKKALRGAGSESGQTAPGMEQQQALPAPPSWQPQQQRSAGQAQCCVCSSTKHQARRCIRASPLTGQLMACTVCNTMEHAVDKCQYFLQLGPEDVVRVLINQRGRLPTVYTENQSALEEALFHVARCGLTVPFTPWSPDFVKAVMTECDWDSIMERYEDTLDVRSHPDDETVMALGRRVFFRVEAERQAVSQAFTPRRVPLPPLPLLLPAQSGTEVATGGVDEDGADKAPQDMEVLGLEEAETSVQVTAATTTGAAANDGEQADAALEARADDVEDEEGQMERMERLFNDLVRKKSRGAE